MTVRTFGLGAGLLIAAATMANPAFAAGVQDDCGLTRPPAITPDTTMSDDVPGDITTADTLTRRLAACGSVLDPPAVGDRDIVAPTPSAGDDMNLHPDAPVRP